MVETLFVKDWLDTYYDELKELLSDKKELEDSSLWILLCAFDDLKDGRVSRLSYKYDDGEEVVKYSMNSVPYGN